ncbi:hypothetical protein VP01_954g3 [Puccinia sorghi]|uniref:Uncharacterized protein n=1 Tax=Puccinia sorghi TaxID=27349 RepID=A0A0L6U695_9BASI|nr:hypothetical protein VP01_954g3 [Puccinia sorghi]
MKEEKSRDAFRNKAGVNLKYRIICATKAIEAQLQQSVLLKKAANQFQNFMDAWLQKAVHLATTFICEMVFFAVTKHLGCFLIQFKQTTHAPPPSWTRLLHWPIQSNLRPVTTLHADMVFSLIQPKIPKGPFEPWTKINCNWQLKHLGSRTPVSIWVPSGQRSSTLTLKKISLKLFTTPIF